MDEIHHLVDAQFEAIMLYLDAERADAGHDPVRSRKLSVAITHAETARLWAKEALK